MELIHTIISTIVSLFSFSLPGYRAQFDPYGLAIGAGMSIMPTVLDWFTGASSKRSDAINKYKSGLASIAARLRGDAGNSATDSLYYKTATTAADQAYKNALEKQSRVGALTGATAESKQAAMAPMNETYQRASLGAIDNAQRERQRLLSEAGGYDQAALASDVQSSQADLDAQNRVGGGLGTQAMSLYQMFKKKKTSDDPWYYDQDNSMK